MRERAGGEPQGMRRLPLVLPSVLLAAAGIAGPARAAGLPLNLDSGGSTTVTIGGALATQPSDATGERPVGDAVLVSPR